MADTCLDHYDNHLIAFPVDPTVQIIIGAICLLARAWLQAAGLKQPGPRIANAYFGPVMVKVLSRLFSVFFAVNVPAALLFFIFREQNDDNSQEFACYLQSGNKVSPGLCVTLSVVCWLILIMAFSNRRLSVRWQVAQRFNDLGFLVPTGAGRPRIAFLQTQSGCWVMPFVKHFVANAASEAGCDVVCFDNYGHPKFSEFKDDQWLRLNLSLEEKESGLAPGSTTLKVILTDYFTLDIPSNSIDVFVMATGANMHILQLDCKNDEEKESRLAQILSEVNRVLRPGGRLLSSSLFLNYELWDTALAHSGLIVPEQPEESAPSSCLPFPLNKLAAAMMTDPNSEATHGTGRKGWLLGLVWWTTLPARLHMAVAPSLELLPPPGTSAPDPSKTAAASDQIDVVHDDIPMPCRKEEDGTAIVPAAALTAEEDDFAGNEPIVFQNSLAERELRDMFPPGNQFRLIEALILINWGTWVMLVLTCHSYIAQLHTPLILPYGKQISALLVSACQLIPTVLMLNADGLYEVGRTGGRLVPFIVLRNKVLRRWLKQRFYFLLVLAFTVLLWAPYCLLDYLLVKYDDKTPFEAQDYNIYIGLAIGLFLMLGGKHLLLWLMNKMHRDQATEDAAEAEDLRHESIISIDSRESAKPDPEIALDSFTHKKPPTTNPLIKQALHAAKEFVAEPRL